MELQLWLAFLGAAIAISLSPGAGAILSMSTGLSHGVRRSYWSIFGLEIGLMAQLILVAVGLGAVLAGSALAFTVVKWLGVVYLLYLAVRQWRSAGPRCCTPRWVSPATTHGYRMLVRGALVNLTNPKGLVFLLAVLPQFVVPDRAAAAAVPGHRRHHGGRRPGRDGRLRRSGHPAAALAEDAAPADRSQPDILGAVRDGRGGAVAGAPRR